MGKFRVYLMPVMLAVLIAGLGSCRERQPAGQKTIEADQRVIIERQIEESVYPLPTSADVINMLTDLEVGYIIGISNPVDNAANYVTSRSRAINMGTYGADLSYATLYNMQQEVIDYLNAIRLLANELNMSKIYDETLYNNIKDNFDTKDELIHILTMAFNNTYSYLVENDLEPLALLIAGGAWVEGMYITTNISESVYHIEGIVRVLLEQKESFDTLIEICQPYADDPVVSEMLQILEPLRKQYAGMDTSLSEKDVINITRTVSEIRDKFVN